MYLISLFTGVVSVTLSFHPIERNVYVVAPGFGWLIKPDSTGSSHSGRLASTFSLIIYIPFLGESSECKVRA